MKSTPLAGGKAARPGANGLAIDSPRSFSELFAPLQAELSPLYWCLDLQSGPFNITGRDDFEELDRELESFFVDSPVLEMCSMLLWRPGIFPRFADLLYEDEWSYYVGLRGPERKAVDTAAALLRAGYLTAGFFQVVDQRAEIFVVKALDDHWEVYSRNQNQLSRLRESDPWVGVSSSKWMEEET
ncbi:MAG: hypothetical protein GY856_24255 [bacterium]|nr:hypothetical protein [bacterium]